MSVLHRIATLLLEKKATLSVAESCTGGLVSHLLTNVPGSSDWYVGGVISYSNELKQGLLGVKVETLAEVGAVSAPVAKQMAVGARQAFDTTYAVSITGIAGPGGGTRAKPVGLTYIAVASPDKLVARRFAWHGTREANKQSSAETALTMLLEALEAKHHTPQEAKMQQHTTVEAAFHPDGMIRPSSFVWEGRTLPITDWGRHWEKDGERFFLVMTRSDQVWELGFSPLTLQWTAQPRSQVRRLV